MAHQASVSPVDPQPGCCMLGHRLQYLQNIVRPIWKPRSGLCPLQHSQRCHAVPHMEIVMICPPSVDEFCLSQASFRLDKEACKFTAACSLANNA